MGHRTVPVDSGEADFEFPLVFHGQPFFGGGTEVAVYLVADEVCRELRRGQAGWKRINTGRLPAQSGIAH